MRSSLGFSNSEVQFTIKSGIVEQAIKNAWLVLPKMSKLRETNYL